MAAFITYAFSFLAFLTCSSFAKSDPRSTQNENEIQASRLLLQHQVGEKISALPDRFNQTKLQDEGATKISKCWADLTAISKNPKELFKCKLLHSIIAIIGNITVFVGI